MALNTYIYITHCPFKVNLFNQFKIKDIKEKAAYPKAWLLDTFYNTKEKFKRNLFFVI